MGIRLTANGTEGQNNYNYNGSGMIGRHDTLQYTFYVLPIPDFSVLNDASDTYVHNLFDEFDERADALRYQSTALQNLCLEYGARSYNYKGYKFCIVEDDTFAYKILYKNGPQSIQETTQFVDIMVIVEPTTHDYISAVMGTGNLMGMSIDPVNFGSIPVFDNTADAYDYLNTDEPLPGDDPGSSSGGNHSIYPSNTYSSITGTVLSELTVVAELDNQNLGYIGAALNNQIDIGADVAQNLNKIVRGIIQGNIADGIMSIKTIPIPSNGSIPYRTGTAETLFKPMGSFTVAGKKLDKTIEKYEIGRMHIEPIFNDYRDYMCEYSIYLPFSGIHKLDADIIVNSNLIVRVDIDFICGSLLYHLSINDNETQRDIYQFTGDCAVEIPITAKDYSEKYAALMNGIFSGVGMTAGVAGGSPFAAISAGTAGLQTLGNAAMTKPNYIQSGKLIPNASAMSVMSPYLIISKPQDKTPDIRHLKGLPCHKVKTLGQCSGFTVATQVDLSNIPYATDEDKEELRSLLSSGVYM